MFQTILVPLDGSKRAESILPYVEDLCGQGGRTLILLQVIDPWAHSEEGPSDDLPSLYEELVQQMTQEAGAYLAGVQAALRQRGMEVRTRIGVGSVVSQIIATARQEGADLIAMVSHGHTGLERVFYGSVAAGVLHAVDRPLLLVRAPDTDPAPRGHAATKVSIL